MKIPIKNLYYLLCFAWRYVPEEMVADISAIPVSSDVLDLCAYLLVTGTDYLLRRGLDQSYLLREEQTTRLRGRIRITATVRGRSWGTPQAICEFDDLSPNVLHNQILRTTIGSLMRAPIVDAELAEGLRTTYAKLSGIDSIQISDAAFRRVQLHRNNSYYGFLLSICRLVHSLSLPDPAEGGGHRFRDLVSDEKAMERVFEEFLRNFYTLKKQEFHHVGSVHLTWNAEAADATNLDLLPAMRTDISLRSTTRSIIIDAKYYKDALQEYYGARKAHSGNLYQLLAYLRAESSTSGDVRPEGILLYPVGDSTIDAAFTIDGFSIRLYTLNLAQDWQDIERDLLTLF